MSQSGAVLGAAGESWSAIGDALKNGTRGLPGGWTIRQLLHEHRAEQRKRLTLEQIWAWGKAHRAATGAWPRSRSGAVAGVPGETWVNINFALYRGLRGLPGGMSLAQLFGRVPHCPMTRGCTPFRIREILAWADAHHAATGQWPTADSGPVRAAPSPLTWDIVETALAWGARGLPGGQSLAQLLEEHRAHQPTLGPESAYTYEAKRRPMAVEGAGHDRRATLSIDRILAAADAHHAATGNWPDIHSGPIPGLPGETWNTINRALVRGRRGLTGGTSLTKLLRQHRERQPRGLTTLSLDLILRWADAYREAHGCWPDKSSGPVDASVPDTWANIDRLLARGGRGLPGGSTLCRVLAEHRGVRYRRMEPDLVPAQILAWAEAHHAATGQWPSMRLGRVSAAPEEAWHAIDRALRLGRRGLAGGSSLARFMAEHLPAYSRVLTVEQIVSWGEAHHAAHGRWPRAHSGPVIGVPGENWANIAQALWSGGRGLPVGLTLSKLFPRCKPPAPGPGS
jgi:hypothetical protein